MDGRPRPPAARRVSTIGVGAAAGALAASAASAAIIALTVTLGTWALDYVAAARGGAIAAVAAYTPSAALRVFEHGELRVSTVLVLLDDRSSPGSPSRQRGCAKGVTCRAASPASRPRCSPAIASLCVVFAQLRASRDVSEDRRNSFPRADEAALRRIDAPLDVTVYLAAEDPRLTDLERGVLAKLRRTMRA